MTTVKNNAAIVGEFDTNSEERKTAIKDANMIVASSDASVEDLRSALQSTVSALEGLNSLVENLLPDLVGIVKVVAEQEMKVMANSGKIATIIVALEEAEITTEEKLKEEFEKTHVPQILEYFSIEKD